MKAKVFCVGFHKTGTCSLGRALELMGYKNCHGPRGINKLIGVRTVMEHLFKKDYSPLFEFAEHYDSFNDSPWFIIYKELDAHFKGSKFILMVRDKEDWIESCVRCFGEKWSPYRFFIYGRGFPVGNEERYLKFYEKHNEDVISYFKNRPDDLLVVRLEDPDKAEKIRVFLNSEIKFEFPLLNQS